jgi:uncharacterized protein (TIGR03118 family)
MLSWVQRLARVVQKPRASAPLPRKRLLLEALEDRCLLSASSLFQQTNLISDQRGVAQILDPNLVNPWGVALSPGGGALWVSDQKTGVATLYSGDVNGSTITKSGLVVTVPGGSPTGQVFNSTSDFVVTAPTGEHGPAAFIFASKTGHITGWNPGVPLPAPSRQAQNGATVPGAVFTGLAIASTGGKNFLYAADFANGQIDVFDSQFHQTTLTGSFTDPNIPANYAPFNIQELNGQLYVTYALQDAAKDGGDVPGVGKGFVDVFNNDGTFVQRVASRGALNAPWGAAIAPSNFGSLSGDLLVGNFGDGHIEAYDPTHHYAFVGQVLGADGKPVTIPGLWALQFGNGVSAGDKNTLLFTAGPNGATHGLLGTLTLKTTVSVDQFIAADSTLGLRVVTTGANDTVSITDDAKAGTTTVVSDGKTQVFDHLFSHFDLQLHSTIDHLTFNEANTLSGRQEDVRVDLGTGENHFTFNPGLTGITNHSNLSLNVLGHNGNDFVNLSFGDILESRVNVQEHGIGGSKTPISASDFNDSITFGTQRAGGRNASVDVNVSFGQGNNNLLFNYGIDLGHLAPPAGTPDSRGDFGPGTFIVNITDSGRRQDTDNVMLFANGEINTSSTLEFNTQMGAGNNSFKAVFDANLFQVDDDGGVFSPGPTPGTFAPHSGGAAHFNVLAGSGKDAISFQSINQDHTIELSGLFDINIFGGSGKDTIRTDFGGAGFTDDDPFELAATNRAFRLRIDGGTGNDTIKVNLANAPTATFAYDVAIVGGSGTNDITFIGTNPVGGTPKFADAVFIDGGFDGNSQVDVFGNFPVQVVNADG